MDNRHKLLWALVALLVVQLLHGLDELRTNDAATVADALATPGTILGVVGTLAAIVAVAVDHRWARTLALLTGSLVALGFVLVHGIPTASKSTDPYWGDGSADAIQWAGVITVWIACAAVVALARATSRRGAPGSLEPSS